MAERNTHANVWVPVAAGMMGAGLALLFAPRSGRETRDRLQSKMGDVRDKADKQLHAASGRLKDGVEEARDLKSRVTGALKRRADEAEREMESLKTPTKSYRNSEDSAMLNNWDEEI